MVRAPSRRMRRPMGRSQVVRQRILIPPCGGSNPPTPASNIRSPFRRHGLRFIPETWVTVSDRRSSSGSYGDLARFLISTALQSRNVVPRSFGMSLRRLVPSLPENGLGPSHLETIIVRSRGSIGGVLLLQLESKPLEGCSVAREVGDDARSGTLALLQRFCNALRSQRIERHCCVANSKPANSGRYIKVLGSG